ncbi:LysR family transcriptional regulator [Mesorhizobium sp. BR1-1-16]|uniref:LysR family transcriptional regulator n=1 Tax=Mesorhizobium sp. BR1-1-16 TaxID=2876653 RepID=UPI001CCB8524|nr:LysR family transcriptional regulator [Mesorhizobium sp. BR1-1-16]MBZ9936491.1 LysR family transcriptional regulator [Mesorhizobium sp. BR1-1-16]
MKTDLGDLDAFVAVARAGGFREAARVEGVSASSLSEAVRRLEQQLGLRLLNRTTRSVRATEAGQGLLDRLEPALGEVRAALDIVDGYRDRPAGTLRLNVPVAAVRLVLPAIVPGFLATYPEIRLEITAEDSFVDLIAAGCDAGIRYDERLEQDMIAVPIGPRVQRFAVAAAPSYLDRRGRPSHPRDLLGHDCLRFRFSSGARHPWEFQRGDEVVHVDPPGPFEIRPAGEIGLAIDIALGGVGIVAAFETWLRPHLDAGTLEPVLEDWWLSFTGPFLYFPGRRLVPPPLRAFVDYIKSRPA